MDNSTHSEKTVIGSLLIDGSLYEFLELNAEHFGSKEHELIYSSMQSLYKKSVPIDVETVSSELGKDIEKVGGLLYLVELAESVPTTQNLEYYEQNVFREYRSRKGHELIREYNKNRTDQAAVELRIALEQLETVGMKDGRTSTRENLMEITNEIFSGENKLDKGYSTGLKDLDKMTGGFQKGNLIIVGARPSMGKTAFALNLSMELSKNGGIPHLFTYEMSTKDLLKRMISTEANIDGDVWLENNFNEEEIERAINAIGELSERQFEVYEYIYKVRKMKAIMRKAIQEQPDKNHMLVVDYLGFVQAENQNQNKTAQIEEITQGLKLLARELDIPVVLLSQLNRGVEQRENKRPVMSDLRDSGSIEQDGDLIMFLYRDEYYYEDSEDKGIVELIISKHRNGAIGSLDFAFVKEHGKFLDINYKYEEWLICRMI